MSECILFYTKLHRDESLAPSEGGEGRGGLEGVLPPMAYTEMCRWQGMVSDLSVLNEVCNFVTACQQGIACTRLVSFAGSILYNTKKMTIT